MPGFLVHHQLPRACVCVCACACVLSCFSRVRLFANLWTVAHQALLSRRILQARILEWVATLSSRGSSQPRDRSNVSYVSCIGRQVLYHSATWEAQVSMGPQIKRPCQQERERLERICCSGFPKRFTMACKNPRSQITLNGSTHCT